jgi:hypothetical protein
LVDSLNDPVVDICVGLLGLLETHQSAVKKFHLVHLIGADIDAGLFHATRLQLDGCWPTD